MNNIKINIPEALFIVANAETMYNKLKKDTTAVAGSDELYTLTVSSLLAVYRKILEVEIDDNLLLFYTETVKAIITEDEDYINNLCELLK